MLGREIAAVGGTVRVANGCVVEKGHVVDARVPRQFLPGVQVVEYLRALGRLGWNRLGGNVIIGGFWLLRKDHRPGHWRRSIFQSCGGTTCNPAPPLSAAQKSASEVPFIPDPVAWTEVPATAAVLGRQRERWHRGLVAAMWQYKSMLFNPRYGRIGLIAVPFYTFGEMLAPVVEVCGYLSWSSASARRCERVFRRDVSSAFGAGMLLSLWAVVLEEVSFRR